MTLFSSRERTTALSRARNKFENVLDTLGRPTERGERYAIYCGDATELLTRVPNGSVDLTLTSPPYNIGKEYEQVLGLDEYLSWCGRWIAEVHRITTDRGAFWLNLGYLSISDRARAIPIPYLLWERIPFYLIQEIVWNYGAGVAARLSFSPRNEKFLWYVKNPDNYVFNLDDVRDPNVKYPNQKKNGKLKCNPLGKNPSDVWQIPKVTSGANRSSKERMQHPAQFPIAVVERIIRASTNDEDLVLDPFVGSGSSLEAALRAERYGIGFEINQTYVEGAADRLETWSRQGQLL